MLHRISIRFIFGLCFSSFLVSILPASGQHMILREDFEGTFPGSWDVRDENSDGEEAYWENVALILFGSPPERTPWAGYCAGTGYGGSTLHPQYADDMLAIMSKTIDLRGYTNASLSFWQIIPSIESGVDGCSVTIDQTVVFSRKTPLAAWTQQTIDLTPYVGATHTLSFQFFSDDSITAEGWYLDDILVTGGGGPTPFRLTNPIWSEGTFKVSLSTQVGFTYHLEAKQTLAASWATVQSAPGTGGVIQMSDFTGSRSSRYYRVRAQ